jgi:elongation factor Ts
LRQTFIRDDKLTIQDLVQSVIAILGENIIVKRFVRFELGE